MRQNDMNSLTFLPSIRDCSTSMYYDPNSGKCEKCSPHCYSCTGKSFYECNRCSVTSVRLQSGCIQAFSIRLKSISVEPEVIINYERKEKELFRPYAWIEIWDQGSDKEDVEQARSVFTLY